MGLGGKSDKYLVLYIHYIFKGLRFSGGGLGVAYVESGQYNQLISYFSVGRLTFFNGRFNVI